MTLAESLARSHDQGNHAFYPIAACPKCRAEQEAAAVPNDGSSRPLI